MQPRSCDPTATRRRLAERVASRALTPVPLCADPLTARLADQIGYQAGYVSGGALGFSLAISEALLTLDELTAATRAITRRCDLPIIVDGAVGFGDPVHVTRMMWDLEDAGAAAVEIEDQVAPKRVSHHRGIEHMVSDDEMAAKVAAAVTHEGVDAACRRARAYVDAGADVILVPIPATHDDIAAVAAAVHVPLATIGLLDGAIGTAAPGIGLYIDSMTPQVLTYRVTKELLERHLQGEPSGLEPRELMRSYRELATTGGFEGLYDIERATTEPGT